MKSSLQTSRLDLSGPPLLRSSKYPPSVWHGHNSSECDVSYLDYHAVGEQLEPWIRLPHGSRRPIAALQDILLEERVHRALTTFLGEHDLADKVLAKAEALLDYAPHPLFCYAKPTCAATIHEWRIRVLEPLLAFLLGHYTYKTLGSPVDPSHNGLHFIPPDASQPAGITLFLSETGLGTTSCLPIIFEPDSSFMTFGPQPNLFASKDQCAMYLEQEDPIPLDPNGKSLGAQAMLNKLAVAMESAILQDSVTGTTLRAPRFGMIIGSRMSVLAEMVENPQNAQEVGYVFSSILLDPRDDVAQRDLPMPFRFKTPCPTLLVLAALVDYLSHTPVPPPETIARLFGAPKIDIQQPRSVSKQDRKRAYRVGSGWAPLPSSVEVWNGRCFTVRAKLDRNKQPQRFVCRTRGRLEPFLGEESSVTEAIKFKVFEKPSTEEPRRTHRPSRRLSVLPPSLVAYLERGGAQRRERIKQPARLSPLGVENASNVPVLDFLKLVALGGTGWVYGGKLSRARSQSAHRLDAPPNPTKKELVNQQLNVDLDDGQTPSSTMRLQTTKSRMPWDHPVVIKAFRKNDWDSIIAESLFYEHVFPLLSPEAQALLPRYYGTFRSTDGKAMMLVLGYGGRLVRPEDQTAELEEKKAAAFRVFYEQGIQHGDAEYQNVLLRDDGSVCIIDWNHAQLDFDPRYLRDPVLRSKRRCGESPQ
ncbi:BZ3500_MvSof-1268-A1-R1_Chr5-2g08009 [Microbotryum saponariae]|uniref:BZ3500_MvSof-1268-A1-R1_Chr5-2g08009 protein n=1 Tax=Microbotryum saponariae TaxID=289078 RepID=A0A2X0L1N7_9BASI|nr:BZ3500_MvSof-1268-A1-R1_Chr5-2g08009 [Microbotryum saponariae]SDA05878.1 BZ3501_MvSof-1269-A2-R1_Chr5-2g07831 [Microbotryum saponariae]